MRKVPQGVGLYLAVLQFVFTLGWSAYAFYLPKLAAAVGLTSGTVIVILMLDQVIFTVTDLAMGIASDRLSRLVGRLGHWMAGVTLVSGLAFLALPFIASARLGAAPFLALTLVWAVTSSALRAPPLMLLGKYAARPAIPYLASVAMVGLGVAGAISPYLTMVLANQDPRLPFAIASIALVLTALALAGVERTLAKAAPDAREPPVGVDRAVPAAIVVFAATSLVLAAGYQLHFYFNSAPLFKKFTADIGKLMPVFWIGFSLSMFPASLITKRLGGLPVMGAAAVVGAVAIAVMELSNALALTVTAQFIAGGVWGCVLMSAFAAAAAIGATGHEGKTTGLLFATLALATFARMATGASGVLANPTLLPLVRWAPIACWAIAGGVLAGLSAAYRRKTAPAASGG